MILHALLCLYRRHQELQQLESSSDGGSSILSMWRNNNNNNNNMYNTSRRRLESAETTQDIVLVIVCICSAAIANGLTQGLLSIDPLSMAIKMRSGTDEEKFQANRIYPIITKHHFLLCTLMLYNASANEALPIFLDGLVPSWLAIVLSVTLVLLAGEILPGAVFTGRHQIKIASTLCPLTVGLMIVFSPIAYPLSLALDYVLGADHGMTIYNRYEMAAMMQIQHEEVLKRIAEGDVGGHHPHAGFSQTIQQEEISIIDGALKFRDLRVAEVMTPVDKVFTLPLDGRLDFKTMANIFKSGFSRIPICGLGGIDDITGLMLVKDLIFIDPDDETPIGNFIHVFGRSVITVWPDQKLHEVLKVFRSGRGHLAVVKDVNNSVADKDPFFETVGIITLEDIIGEILGEDISDETDVTAKDANRDIDFARLITLIGQQGTAGDEHTRVSLNEAKVIANHLLTTVPQVRELLGPTAGPKSDAKHLIEFVMSCPVFVLEGGGREAQEYLYRRGKVSSTCTLILHGKVMVLAGKDEFKAEQGAWDVLGADALLADEGSYLPDFSAHVASDTFRCLNLSRALWTSRLLSKDKAARQQLTRTASVLGAGAGGGETQQRGGGGGGTHQQSQQLHTGGTSPTDSGYGTLAGSTEGSAENNTSLNINEPSYALLLPTDDTRDTTPAPGSGSSSTSGRQPRSTSRANIIVEEPPDHV